MKKETLIAIFFGIGLGVVLACFFIMRSKENQLTKAKPISNITKSITPKVKILSTSILEITSPTDNIIVNKNSITIKGKTNKNAFIVINSPIKEIVFKTEKEEFNIDFPLALGENVIQLTSYPDDKTGTSINKTLLVYYLTNND